MPCEFADYSVAKYEDENVKLAGRLWVATLKEIKGVINEGKDVVITIVGKPGMGKTTVLNAVKKDLKGHFIIYLDLVGNSLLSKTAWYYIENTNLVELIRSKAYSVLEGHKKDIGYTFMASLSKEFNNWLKHLCEKRKWHDEWGYAERAYCMQYDRDINGVIALINDLSRLGKTGVLLDELKADQGVLYELHKLINEVRVPIVITAVPEVITEIKDKALLRRLNEFKRELILTEEDKKEILSTYCPDYAEELFSDQQIRRSDTVSSLIDIARITVRSALEECEDEEFNKDKCVREKLTQRDEVADPQDASRKLEVAIRSGLLELKDKFNIKYVHKTGRRINEKHVTVDIFFIKDDIAYLGDVKISNDLTLDNISNMKKLIDYEKYQGYPVKKFLVTNVTNVDLPGFKVVPVDLETINKVVNGDVDRRNKLVEEILRELG
ncbi:hypothetical protein [Stygiolobus caldivivus]|uniref:Uncharacterized protein n=1 Tax=Stygiolobus caldivivus TaxID=2824673 RepID=A0A8D5U580_9CREN|nr:hypothetical protein [Stygiolobus caldivivus]BCU69686.1 hypothetical protein KN1_09830 [Stygiolobus caldivivus]